MKAEKNNNFYKKRLPVKILTINLVRKCKNKSLLRTAQSFTAQVLASTYGKIVDKNGYEKTILDSNWPLKDRSSTLSSSWLYPDQFFAIDFPSTQIFANGS